MLKKICKLFIGISIFIAMLIVQKLEGLSAQERKSKPSILWIMLDQCRTDVFSCYGNTLFKTPNIDRLASKGVLFANAFVTGMPCVPSRISFFSSLYPHQHGVFNNDWSKMRPEDSNLLKPLKESGFGNIYGIGKVHFNISELTAGFTEHYHIKPASPEIKWVPDCRDTYPAEVEAIQAWKGRDLISGHEFCKPEETYCARGVDMAIEAYDRLKDSDSPFLLYFGPDRPHSPVTLTSPYYEMFEGKVNLPDFDEKELENKPFFQRNAWQTRKQTHPFTPEQNLRIKSSYYGMVVLLDEQIGRLLKYVEKDWLNGNLLIIFTADHGCYLGEHGLYTKILAYSEVARVPLVISWPGQLPEGKKINGLVESIDLLPTLLDIYKIPNPGTLSGKSLLPLMKGQADKIKDAVFNESKWPSWGCQTVRAPKWSYTRYAYISSSDDHELYDLEKDPKEKVNLAGKPEYKDVVKMLNEMLDKRLGQEAIEFHKAKTINFEFEKPEDVDCWIPSGGLANLKIEDGKLTGDIKLPGFMICGFKSLLDGNDYPAISICMKATEGNLAQFYWITEDSSQWDENKTIRFSIKGDGEFHTYVLETGKNEKWAGKKITGIRLNPVRDGCTSAKIEIDWIIRGGY